MDRPYKNITIVVKLNGYIPHCKYFLELPQCSSGRLWKKNLIFHHLDRIITKRVLCSPLTPYTTDLFTKHHLYGKWKGWCPQLFSKRDYRIPNIIGVHWIFWTVRLTFEMLTVCGKQHSFSTHERMFLWECQCFPTWGAPIAPVVLASHGKVAGRHFLPTADPEIEPPRSLARQCRHTIATPLSQFSIFTVETSWYVIVVLQLTPFPVNRDCGKCNMYMYTKGYHVHI